MRFLAAVSYPSVSMDSCLKNSYPPNFNAPWKKYPTKVGPTPVQTAPKPFSPMICLNPPIKPRLYLTGSSWIDVFTLQGMDVSVGEYEDVGKFEVREPSRAAL